MQLNIKWQFYHQKAGKGLTTVHSTYQWQVQINKLDVEKRQKKCIHNTCRINGIPSLLHVLFSKKTIKMLPLQENTSTSKNYRDEREFSACW